MQQLTHGHAVIEWRKTEPMIKDMPHFRVYDGEVKDLPIKKLDQSWREYYDSILINYFNIGMFGEAELYADETVQSVSILLSQACHRLGLGIEVISQNRGVVFFKVICDQQQKMEL